ncbi:MFS transporter [Streptomyces sp. NPDC047009]|uniref:MFS transporter n=1 Tax=Streptomyces sp. NPDC047009 TaxID=3154496 RepID=UPI0033F552FE
MLGFGLVPVLIIIWLRRRVPESPRWLAQNDREREACEVGRALVGTPVQVTPRTRNGTSHRPKASEPSFSRSSSHNAGAGARSSPRRRGS